MKIKRYKLTIEYDGNYFCGWQKQKCSSLTELLPSVQFCIEEAIFKFSGKKVKVVGSGRTDSGVHAVAQVAHFDLSSDLTEKKILLAINFHLKNHRASVIAVEEVQNDFHARFSALRKHYRYRIINRQSTVVLEKQFVWQVFKKMNYELLLDSSKELIGKHNFSSFCSSAFMAHDTNKTIENIIVIKNGDLIELDFISKSFLYNQVRIMVGTLVDISLGKNLNISDIIKKENRQHAGKTAPPYGLYLMKVEYDNKIND